MAGVIDSFLIALGFQADTKGAEDYKASLESVERTLATLTGVAAAAAAGIGWVVHKAAESMGALNDFANMNDVSAAAVDTLGKAAVAFDSSLDAVKSSIQGLNSIIGEASLGVGRGAMIFQKLGLSAKDANGNVKNTTQMLEEVSGKIQNMSRPEQLAYLAKLRIDPSLIQLLKDGPEAFRQIKEDFGGAAIFSDEDYEMADKVDKLFNKASASVGIFAKQLAVSLFPVVKQALEAYMTWFKESRKANGETIAKALQLVVAVLQTVVEYVLRFAGAIKQVIVWLKQFELVTWAAAAALTAFVSIQAYKFTQTMIQGIIALTRTMLAFNATALLIPAIIGALIIAAAVLFDEFINFREGNESFIGDLVQEYPQLLNVINKISDGVAAVVDWVMSLFNTLKPAFSDLGSALINLFSALWPVIQFFFTAIGALLSVLLPIALDIFTKIIGVVAWAVEKMVSMIAWITEAFAKVINGFASGIDWVIGKIQAVIDLVKGAIGFVSKLIGGTSDSAAGVNSAVASDKVKRAAAQNTQNSGLDPVFAGDYMYKPAGQQTGGLGAAAGAPAVGNNSTVTNSTTVNVPAINVTSPDPNKAGQNVKDELNKSNRQATRNGQSAVAL